ncbi:MAG: winged helix-turn-helix domain-containing protein, partial [Selenomonadaceae bacterium]|nr:winged helix-turn-helix domain-containing protein [Selenomonadaceae bacterium]
MREYVKSRIIEFKEKGYAVKEIGELLNINDDYAYKVLKKYRKNGNNKSCNHTTITDYLRRWGMTCQRPANRATKQNETAIKEFQEVTFREIVLKAKKEGGMILFGDETGIYNQENYQEEYLNNMLKKNVHSGELPHTEKQLEQKDQKFYEQNFTSVGKNFKFVSPKKFV